MHDLCCFAKQKHLCSASFNFLFLLFINVHHQSLLAYFVSYSLNFSSLGLSGDSRKITLSWYVQLVNCRLTPIIPVSFAFLLLLLFHHPSFSLYPTPHMSTRCHCAAPCSLTNPLACCLKFTPSSVLHLRLYFCMLKLVQPSL